MEKRDTTQQRNENMTQNEMKIFNAIGNMTLLLDMQHNILAANCAIVTGLGRTEEELKGKKCYEIFHRTAQPPESCPLEKMLRSNSMETYEMVVEALNGTYLVSCTPLFDENGNLEKVIHIATDITEHKLAEEELKKYREHLEEIVKERTAELIKKNEELEHFNKLFVGRELRMVELKKTIAEKERKISELEKEIDDLKIKCI